MASPSPRPRRSVGVWLSMLTVLFLVRVIAQPAALLIDHPLLPRFESWQSGLVPYRWLLVFQLAILAAMSITTWTMATGQAIRRPSFGRRLSGFGAVYFGATVLRAALGATLWSRSTFFAAPLPIAFHLVLASFLLLCGYYHVDSSASRETMV